MGIKLGPIGNQLITRTSHDIWYDVYDINDNIIGKFKTYKSALKAFKERYPYFSDESCSPFIFETDVGYTICLPEYSGVISMKSYKKGKIQRRVCEVIAYTVLSIGRNRTEIQISRLWKFDEFEIKKNIKLW